MKASTILLSVFGGVFFLGLVGSCSLVGINNSLVNQEEDVGAKWSQVQNVYQRRADLIPNLVEVVKGYATHEHDTLVEVAQARNQAAKIQLPANPTADQLKVYQDAQQGLGNALSRLMVVTEKYPELKANENFRDLQKQIEGTENRIAVERRVFNETTRSYNTSIRSFPDSFVASFKGMKAKAYFEADTTAAKAPVVKF